MKEENQSQKKKLTLKERLKDKREKAKLELMLYGIFFIGVIIFARVLGGSSSYVANNISEENQSFIYSIEDNYEYDIIVTTNENTYEYYGKVLGNNSTINLVEENKTNSYYLMNKKYYVLEDNNYILTDEDEVYPYIDYRYLNISSIKEYVSLSTKENNTYKVKVADLLLNSESEDYVLINIEEGDKNIVIDYTPLLKETKENISQVVVNITYNNIGNIISLEE